MISADGDLDEAVAAETGKGRFQTCVSTAGISIVSDEPVAAGGLGSGPTPYQLLASALAAVLLAMLLLPLLIYERLQRRQLEGAR